MCTFRVKVLEVGEPKSSYCTGLGAGVIVDLSCLFACCRLQRRHKYFILKLGAGRTLCVKLTQLSKAFWEGERLTIGYLDPSLRLYGFRAWGV